jgi:hypothetical protein
MTEQPQQDPSTWERIKKLTKDEWVQLNWWQKILFPLFVVLVLVPVVGFLLLRDKLKGLKRQEPTTPPQPSNDPSVQDAQNQASQVKEKATSDFVTKTSEAHQNAPIDVDALTQEIDKETLQ